MNRRAASANLVLAAAVVVGACSSSSTTTDGAATSTTPSPPLTFDVDQGPEPRALLDAIVWPAALTVVGLSDAANEQLLKALTDDPRVGPFVLDAAAIGLGEDRSSVAAVLAVRVAPDAAADPTFRSTVEGVLCTEPYGDDAITVIWRESTLVVVRARDTPTLTAIVTAIRASNG